MRDEDGASARRPLRVRWAGRPAALVLAHAELGEERFVLDDACGAGRRSELRNSQD